jgi:hypothetical protein
MADPEDVNTAEQLRGRLLGDHPDWVDRIVLDCASERPLLTFAPPHWPEHRMTIEICRREATVAYSDGLPPGPAEALFIWGDAPTSQGIKAICSHVDALVDGRLVLVRERLSRVVQFLRRHDCDSLLDFVPKAELNRWSRRRRHRILSAWSWSGERSFAV